MKTGKESLKCSPRAKTTLRRLVHFVTDRYDEDVSCDDTWDCQRRDKAVYAMWRLQFLT